MLKQDIIDQAAADHAQHPQYQGHWDGEDWYMVVFTKRVTTKMGIAFEAGDVTIAHGPAGEDEYDTFPTAYSLRNKIDTSVRWNSFQRVTEAVATREP